MKNVQGKKNVLVINCGSSSLKYQLLDMEHETLLAKGLIERIGLKDGIHSYSRPEYDKIKETLDIPDHQQALDLLLAAITHGEHGVLDSMDQVHAVGHRVVHAGEAYSGSVVIDQAVVNALTECISLAPLHNPANITGIKAAQKAMPNIPMVGVFDTAFHQTMPPRAYLYPLPYSMYKDYGIRRYGFHGTSHRYVTLRAAHMLGKDLNDLNLITCHLGNGASMTAVRKGKSIETSMGLTPLEGLIMGTRCGDIDPALIGYISRRLEISLEEVEKILNKESGILGVTGISSDMRDIEFELGKNNKRARLGLEIYAYRVRKYIGAYAAVLGHIDAIVFTAGVGERFPLVREWACQGLEVFGAHIDIVRNAGEFEECVVSTEDSKVKILIVPTNEELMIARDTLELVL